MKLQLIILVACTLCMSTLAAQTSRETVLETANSYQQQLASLLTSLNDVTGVPGFSAAIIHKGKLVASVATGFSDVANDLPAKSSTTFRLASVSKIVGAVMLAELVVNNRLDPDVGIGQYYPELNSKYHNITLRELLSHTSGMPHYQSKDYDIYNKSYSSATEALETLKGRDLLSRPGYQYHYSTHGYTLAGAIYERITGQPLSVGVSDFVKRWTGQSTPRVENISNLNTDSSKLYKLTKFGAKEIAYGEKSYSVFGAGLYSSAEDLASFGAKVLKMSKADEKYHQLLFTPTKNKNGKVVTDRDFQVGFGWRISSDLFGRTVYHHAGATPGARSILAIYPEHELSIAFLSNSSWISSIDKLASALASLYLDGAEAISIASTKYQITNKNQSIVATTECQMNKCFFKDDTTDYSLWLNTFNASSERVKRWPGFIYRVGKKQRLYMVNKVGIGVLENKRESFSLETGKHQTYSIKLLDTKY